MGGGTYFFGETGDFVGPDVFCADGVVGVAFDKKVLEEAHVLEGEHGDLVLGLYGVRYDVWRGKRVTDLMDDLW